MSICIPDFRERRDGSTNWVAGYKEGSSFQYRTINSINDSLIKINDKGEETFDYVYIGICGIRDYDLFWKYTDEILEETTTSDSSDCHVISYCIISLMWSVIRSGMILVM